MCGALHNGALLIHSVLENPFDMKKYNLQIFFQIYVVFVIIEKMQCKLQINLANVCLACERKICSFDYK